MILDLLRIQRAMLLIGLSAVYAYSSSILSAATLRVITINVWSGLDYKGILKMGEYEDHRTRQRRTASLFEQLRMLDPDVVAFNEANPLPRYARRAAKDLGYDPLWHVGLGGVRFGPVGIPTNLREGSVLLARPELHLKPAGRKQLSGGPVGNLFAFHFTDANQIIGGRISLAGRDVFLFTTHWHSSPHPTEAFFAGMEQGRQTGKISPKEYRRILAWTRRGAERRLREARKALSFIEREAAGCPVILLGDLNALANSEEIELLRNAGFVDAFASINSNPQDTWDEDRNTNIHLQGQKRPEWIPWEPRNKRIDYILLRGPGLSVKRAQVVLDQPINGQYVSDHFGVLAEIIVE
jgi:endonuclease/exonuclease/phosphatase family metal-dependent hydrolase